MAKISYMTVGSNKLEEAKAFYDDLLGSIGMKGVYDHPSGGRLYRGRGQGCSACWVRMTAIRPASATA